MGTENLDIKELILTAIEVKEIFASLKKQNGAYSCHAICDAYSLKMENKQNIGELAHQRNARWAAHWDEASNYLHTVAEKYVKSIGFTLDATLISPDIEGKVLTSAFVHDLNKIQNRRLWEIRQEWLSFLIKEAQEHAARLQLDK